MFVIIPIKLRKIFTFISIVLICNFSVAQVKEAPANVDVLTKKLEKVNNTFQKKVLKLQKKLEKKLIKKYPNLDAAQLDSLIEAKTPDFLPDSLTSDLVNLEGQSTQIGNIKQQIQEKLKLTPPNLDIGKDLNVSIKELDKLQSLYDKLQIPNMDELKSKRNLLKDKLPISPTELKQLQAKSGDLNGVLDEYKKEFEGWEEKLLAEVTSLEEVKLLQEQQKRLADYKPLPDGYRDNIEQFQSNDFVKTKLEEKAAEFQKIGAETLQEKFDKALTKVTDAKKKFPSLESLKDAPKRPPNPLKNQPFTRRLRLGGNIQVNRQAPTSVDFALQVGYLLTPKSQIGLGSAYRFSTGEKFSSFNLNNELFTVKLFYDHFISKSFYAQGVVEWNRKALKDLNDVSLGNEWVQSGLVGIGKEIPFSKKLKGTISVLYNLLHDQNSPYQRPLVFRVGFRL